MLASPLFLERLMNNDYYGVLGDIPVFFRFKYKDTANYFGTWLRPVSSSIDPIIVPQVDFDYSYRKFGTPDQPYFEYSLSVYRACDKLLPYERCIFHGAAFLWHEKAFIFTAPSGTGKSTQLKHWNELYGNEIEQMNGDKPVLAVKHNQVIVMPSPWKGKERIGNDALCALLGGIIVLSQDQTNSMKRLKTSQSVPILMQRILFTVETEELVHQASKMVEKIVTVVPVWCLSNTGDTDSAILTHDSLKKELFEDEV